MEEVLEKVMAKVPPSSTKETGISPGPVEGAKASARLLNAVYREKILLSASSWVDFKALL